MKNLILLMLVMPVFWQCSNNGDKPAEPEKKPESTHYSNPVLNTGMPDPTIIKAANGSYYVYATEDTRNMPIYTSKDLVSWAYAGTVFNDATRPNFEPGGGLWAPDINYINGKYVLYYSMSVWGGETTCGIGVATATEAAGPFRDHGKLIRSGEIGVQNSIDPFYIEDDGKKYLFWGSFRGIYAIELADDGLTLKNGAEKQQITVPGCEGTCMYKKGDYYYLFASTGTCCEGVNSTYKLMVCRSANLFGPYVDKAGANGFELVIGSNERFVGNGHCSEIVQDDAGDDWIFYHGVDVTDPEGRRLMLDKVEWVNGWPVVNDGAPALSAKKPHFEL